MFLKKMKLKIIRVRSITFICMKNGKGRRAKIEYIIKSRKHRDSGSVKRKNPI